MIRSEKKKDHVECAVVGAEKDIMIELSAVLKTIKKDVGGDLLIQGAMDIAENLDEGKEMKKKNEQ